MPDYAGLFEREREKILDEVDRRIALLRTTIAAQDDGSVVANDHRILNFQGPGVVVTDDPTYRRTNVYVPGTPASDPGGGGGTTTTIVSGAGLEKVFTLGSAPASWQTTGFNDSGWAASVAMTTNISAFYTLVSGAAWITDVNTAYGGGVVHEFLARRTFTLPAGSITSATLSINADDNFGSGSPTLYLNGVSLGASISRSGTPQGPATIALPVGLLNAGGSNVLAVDVYSNGGSVALSYKLTIVQATAGSLPSGQTLTDYLELPEIAAPGTPGSGYGRLYEKSDGKVYFKNDGGTEYDLTDTGAAGAVATDTLWDAKGDLAVGSGADAAGRLPVGTNGYVLVADSAQTLGVKWASASAPGTAQPFARVSNTSKALASNTSTVLTWATEVADTDSIFTSGTSTSRLTINTDGVYVVTCSATLPTTGGDIQLRKNGTAYEKASRGPGGHCSVTGIHACVATDYFDFTSFADSPGGNATNLFASIVRVSA